LFFNYAYQTHSAQARLQNVCRRVVTILATTQTYSAIQRVIKEKTLSRSELGKKLGVSTIMLGDVMAARISIEDGAFFKGGIDIREAGSKLEEVATSKSAAASAPEPAVAARE
jgi:hypothetical protein